LQAVEELTTVQVDAFPDRLSTPVFDNLNLNKGLVYETGANQRAQKRLCRPSFSNTACLESFLAAIKEESVTLSDRWNASGWVRAPARLRAQHGCGDTDCWTQGSRAQCARHLCRLRDLNSFTSDRLARVR